MGKRDRRGFTLVESLVVMAILGVLLALILPGMQSSREAARRTQCASHLKQLGSAWLLHHESYRRFPSGGWGWCWVGEPERRTGRDQPGGWGFNSLAYLQQGTLRNLGRDTTGSIRAEALAERCGRPLLFFLCPSRRGARAYPDERTDYRTAGHSHLVIDQSARSDYAANTGHLPRVQFFAGPETLDEGDYPDYDWNDTSHLTGVCFERSEVSLSDVTDGASQTYMLGEKYLNPDHYASGRDPGDNENLFVGFDNDLHRSGFAPPMVDQSGLGSNHAFGSAHPSVCQFVFCDGSVRAVSFSIDPVLHGRLANREDGQAVDLDGLGE